MFDSLPYQRLGVLPWKLLEACGGGVFYPRRGRGKQWSLIGRQPSLACWEGRKQGGYHLPAIVCPEAIPYLRGIGLTFGSPAECERLPNIPFASCDRHSTHWSIWKLP